MSGLLVSFLGVDGIGKTTLSRALVRHLEDAGVPVVAMSWRAQLDEAPRPWPGDALRELWLETFRGLYGATMPLPLDYEAWRDGGWERRVAATAAEANRPAGALAAAFAEIAGNVVLAAETIAPARRDGYVVVQDTFPFKHVLKELLLAERLAAATEAGDAVGGLATWLREALPGVFGSPLLRPDVGVLVDGAPEAAYRWRLAETGEVGALEDLGVAGDKSAETFLELQELTRPVFRRLATDWGWLVHDVDDAGLEANVERGLRLVLGHPAIASALAGRDSAGTAPAAGQQDGR